MNASCDPSAASQPVAIALGANLGAPRLQLERAVEELRRLPGLRVVAVSSFHETEPVGGPPGQPRYLNAALLAECALAPEELLAALQELERRAGREREREPRDGPRVLDLDLLLYGTRRVSSPLLELPHPRMLARHFVLAPLAEIAPEFEIAGAGCTVRAALARLEAPGRAR